MESYEELLEVARKQIPKEISSGERFEIPTAQGHVEGNKTIVSNFQEIADILNRDQKHLLKFLQRELATPATIDGPRLILGRKLNSKLINEKIEKYAYDFVICPDCKKPDTQMIKENRVLMLKCNACGAKHPIKSKI